MELYDKIQQIKDSHMNGQQRQTFAFLKEVNNNDEDENYDMTDVIKSLHNTGDSDLAIKLSCQLIEEAY